MISKLKEWFKGLSATNQRLVIAVAVVIGLYYLMSPYQNCMRADNSSGYCIRATSW